MRVALVCPYDWSTPGGVQAHVGALGAHLAEAHEVAILAPASRPPGDGGVDRLVVPVGRPLPVPFNRSVAPVALSPQAARRTVSALREFDPDIVHVHEPLAPTVAMAAAAFGPRPIVGTFHSWSARRRLYRVAGIVARRAVARLDARVAVSQAAQSYAAGALGLPPRAFQVVPNGVAVEAFAHAEPLEHLHDPERPLLLFVGRLEPRKGLNVLIRAFLRLRAGSPRVRLCVVGEGPERERCQEMVPPSIRPDVLFVGRVDEADKARYHASADVFVAPNTGGESFGIVLLEAMAAGLPVVASDIPGFRSVLEDGRQGRMVPPGDAFALADAIATLLANERLRQAMATEGRITAAGYAWFVVGERITRLYEQMLDGSR